jgi:hypothetical protein
MSFVSTVMRRFLHAAAVLIVLVTAGCAHPPMAPKPAAAATPAAPGTVAIVPPMTTYGCDPLLAGRLGKSC